MFFRLYPQFDSDKELDMIQALDGHVAIQYVFILICTYIYIFLLLYLYICHIYIYTYICFIYMFAIYIYIYFFFSTHIYIYMDIPPHHSSTSLHTLGLIQDTLLDFHSSESRGQRGHVDSR